MKTSSCLRDDGGGNLILTVHSKTDQNGSMISKFVLARKDVEVDAS
jgi:hypothetical protein